MTVARNEVFYNSEKTRFSHESAEFYSKILRCSNPEKRIGCSANVSKKVVKLKLVLFKNYSLIVK